MVRVVNIGELFVEGGKHCFSLVMYGFCSNNALYIASLSLKCLFSFNSFHCVKNVQIRSYFWSVLPCIRTEYEDLRGKSPYSVRIQENTVQK